MALEGIDVHDAQGGIDWYRVANDNRAFAFIRAAYGDRVDNLVVQNFVGAKHQGLVCGLYHFYRVTRDAKKQADLMVKILKQSNLGFGKGDLPPVIDVEDNPAYDGPWDTNDNAKMIAGVTAWVDRIRQEFGCEPIVYTRASFWTVLGNPPGFSSQPMWVAHYQNSAGSPAAPTLPAGWSDYEFWQYTDHGHCDGVSGGGDLNRFSGKKSDLMTLTL